MHPQLEAIVEELQSASERLSRLAGEWTEEEWSRRPAEGSWSVAECVAHLNLTSRAYRPILGEGLEQARAKGGGAPRRFRKGIMGWLIWKTAGPKGPVRTKTAAHFVPTAGASRAELLSEFEELQVEQIERVREADGLAIHEVQVVSPFDPRGKYSLYEALAILPAHQHRHLGQAERAVRGG
jgi:hypothetical protein